jgi:alpha-beta hydrolase superfamily lysophospholipase
MPHARPPLKPKAVEFTAADGLRVNADYYALPRAKGMLVLCHRSHFNRGEYASVAPRLRDEGYASLALDQRSGMTVLGYTNQTAARAKKQLLATGYAAARPDIEAAVAYAYARNRRRPVVLVGSSYSASLALLIAAESKRVRAVAVFSPGEHLKGISVAACLRTLDVSVFATAAKDELRDVQKLLRAVPKPKLTIFRPKSDGCHGARVLWPETPGSDEYLAAFLAFLREL